MENGPGEWVSKDAFVLPMLPLHLGIDPILCSLLHCVAFLELSDDGAVDPDWAVEAMEHVASYMGRLPAETVAGIQTQLDQVAQYGQKQKWSADAVEFVQEFLVHCGVGEEEDSDDENE